MNAAVIAVLVIVVVLVALAAVVVGLVLARRKRPSPYERRAQFLTPAERSFFGVIQAAMGERYLVFAKVRVADLLSVRQGIREPQAHLNRIIAKHVDFVLCEPADVRPVLMIELDDSSHRDQRRRDRDQFLDEAFAGAALPMLRVAASRAYDPAALARAIEEKVAGVPA